MYLLASATGGSYRCVDDAAPEGLSPLLSINPPDIITGEEFGKFIPQKTMDFLTDPAFQAYFTKVNANNVLRSVPDTTTSCILFSCYSFIFSYNIS